jgi:hypothetical protein
MGMMDDPKNLERAMEHLRGSSDAGVIAYESILNEQPALRGTLTATDLAMRQIFDRGERTVRVQTDQLSKFPRTDLSPVESWDEYLTVRDWSNSVIMSEADARLYHGWRASWYPRPAPTSHKDRVQKEVAELRVQADAKRIVQAERNPVEPLELKSVAELLLAPAPEWWVDGVLPKDAVVIVGGDGGVGKSAMLVEMVARLSTGTPFLGQYPARKAHILYAVGEGMSGYGARFAAVDRAHGLDADRVRLIAQGVNLTSEKSMEQVRAAVAERKVDVVIFDTLSSLSTLESENDAAEVGRVLNNAKRVREANPGCTVIIVHHTNKASGGLRGSSVIRDNADVVWMLRGDPDAFYMSTKSKHGGKVKDGEPAEIHGLSLVSAHGSVVVESALGPQEGTSTADRRAKDMSEQLIPGTEYSTADLREMARKDDPTVSEATIKRTITTLISMGPITSIGKGRYRAASGQNPVGS